MPDAAPPSPFSLFDAFVRAGVCPRFVEAARQATAAQAEPRPIDLEWRGKSVRLLTPDEMAAFASWARTRIDQVIRERDETERRLMRKVDELTDELAGAEAEARSFRQQWEHEHSDYDTLAERAMDIGR